MVENSCAVSPPGTHGRVHPARRAAQFHCPLGLDFGSNHPHEIALSIAAQLVAERDKVLKR